MTPEQRDWRKMLEQKKNSLSYFWECTVVEEIIEEVERLRQENERLRKYCEACVEAGLSPESDEKEHKRPLGSSR